MIKVAELLSEQDWKNAWPVFRQLREQLTLESFLDLRQALLNDNYRLFGLRNANQITCVAGMRIMLHTLGDKICWIYDFVTAEEFRSQGYGKLMLDSISDVAKSAGATRLLLHTRLSRKRAQNFYEQHAKFEKSAAVYVKKLS